MAYGLRSGVREGFQDGFVYKIMSMKDKKGVMEVENANTTPGTRIITVKKFTGAQSQKFTVARQESGGFQISSVNQGTGPDSVKQCWDFLPHDGLLIQNDLGCAMNQVWVAEEIIPNSKICIIKSKDDGRCLKNMGYNIDFLDAEKEKYANTVGPFREKGQSDPLAVRTNILTITDTLFPSQNFRCLCKLNVFS